ncbi:SEC14-like protein 2 [Orchesella cincta]|uniref:SEC14-like protein 2 n=1 Tax=Orchesella cincta TaxID=48709 RepID=A0A1D2N3L6_ORCCI|nr:SEC14-like protein 2 [Orchesella cincta]
MLEDCAQNMIADQYKGANVTEFSLVMNLDGFNAIQHTCPACLSAYSSFVTAYQNYYPGYTHGITLINTPPIFKTVLDVIQPLFTPRTKKILKIIGQNKKEWQEHLDKEISREALRPEFGGTKKD